MSRRMATSHIGNSVYITVKVPCCIVGLHFKMINILLNIICLYTLLASLIEVSIKKMNK